VRRENFAVRLRKRGHEVFLRYRDQKRMTNQRNVNGRRTKRTGRGASGKTPTDYWFQCKTISGCVFAEALANVRRNALLHDASEEAGQRSGNRDQYPEERREDQTGNRNSFE
jgi:hypothetical protein